jgi:hypothetical protein
MKTSIQTQNAELRNAHVAKASVRRRLRIQVLGATGIASGAARFARSIVLIGFDIGIARTSLQRVARDQ